MALPYDLLAVLSFCLLASSFLFTIYQQHKRSKQRHHQLQQQQQLQQQLQQQQLKSNGAATTHTKGSSARNSKQQLASQTPQASRHQAAASSPKSKQVHFADIISITSNDPGASKVQKQTIETVATSSPIASQHQNTHKAPSGKKTNAKQSNGAANAKNTTQYLETIEMNNNDRGYEQPLGSEPSPDELDSSLLLEEAFNPLKTATASKKQRQTNNNKNNSTEGRKRHSSDSSNHQSAAGVHSAEQLFTMIAATSLTRDEIEMTVETLLNKLESGDTEWHRPKSDPLHRLKNQLRDGEAALATECQNHEQTRARLVELKAQLQNERSLRSSTCDELARLKKDLLLTQATLERAHSELSKQRAIQDQLREESSKCMANLEHEKAQLQGLLANSNAHDNESHRLRQELDEKIGQLKRHESINESLSKRLHELDSNLRAAEMHLEQLRAERQRDDYQTCAKLSQLDSDRNALEQELKDHVIRFNEVLEANKHLKKSLEEMQMSLAHKEDLVRRLSEERQLNEATMKRTLAEMEKELRELHEQLSNKATIQDERYRQELNSIERELTDAGQREQMLKMKMKQLRDGLSELFPDLRSSHHNNNQNKEAAAATATTTTTTANGSSPDDWVQQYLAALKKLSTTVDELRRRSNRQASTKQQHDNDNEDARSSTSKRSLVDKSTLTLLTTNGKSSPSASRVGSPTSNGRSSRASSNYERDKRLMETKLVEDLALFCLRCLD